MSVPYHIVTLPRYFGFALEIGSYFSLSSILGTAARNSQVSRENQVQQEQQQHHIYTAQPIIQEPNVNVLQKTSGPQNADNTYPSTSCLFNYI